MPRTSAAVFISVVSGICFEGQMPFPAYESGAYPGILSFGCLALKVSTTVTAAYDSSKRVLRLRLVYLPEKLVFAVP
jgi:hypothetical protein